MIARLLRLWFGRGVLSAVCALSCAAPPAGTPDSRLSQHADALEATLREQVQPPLEPGALRVRLAFGEDVDLDLFMTDPSYESVYFANKTSRTGGILAEDVRCDAPAPRIETVTLREPRPGRYRIGVDFPRRCNGGDARAALVVAVELPRSEGDGSGELLIQRGEIDTEVFEPIVYQFELP